MIFSKTNEKGIPLWWLIFKGLKTVTRRPPPCLHCGDKHFNHYAGNHCKASGSQTYEPDLSRWQPKEIVNKEVVESMWARGRGIVVEKQKASTYKSIAIQPKRTKAAICANCGGWKEWHSFLQDDHRTYEWGTAYRACSEDARTFFWFEAEGSGMNHMVCKNYVPLRRKIVAVEMESEWLGRLSREVNSAGYNS